MDDDKKKRLDFLKRKNVGKRYMIEYLESLNKLTLNSVEDYKVLSIEETLNLDVSNKKNRKKIYINFDDKERLSHLFNSISEMMDSEIYLFTDYSLYCGVLKLNSITDFNINFSFEDEEKGIITLRTVDNSNAIILDFYEEHGNKLLEIEVMGDEWISAL